MFPKPDKNQTLALAGLIQSSALVCQLTTRDRHDESALHESAFSLLRLDADGVEEVYGSECGVDLGLRTMTRFLAYQLGPPTRYVYQYSEGLYQLSVKLARLEKTGEVIQSGLEEIRAEFMAYYDREAPDPELDDSLYESLAGLYVNTVSFLTPRIIVRGEAHRLQNTRVVHRVRTALFAGIRSAWLWHQLGGRKWQVMMHRRDYIHIAKTIVNRVA